MEGETAGTLGTRVSGLLLPMTTVQIENMADEEGAFFLERILLIDRGYKRGY